MTDQELKKLNRRQLLEMILKQAKEILMLRAELKKMDASLNERKTQFEQVGTLAEAMVSVNGLMKAADQAAQQYLESIRAMKEDTWRECDRLIKEAQEKADAILAGAEGRLAAPEVSDVGEAEPVQEEETKDEVAGE